MGFAPRDVDGMTLWDFNAARAGWIKANRTGDEEAAVPPMSDERLAELGIDGFKGVQ